MGCRIDGAAHSVAGDGDHVLAASHYGSDRHLAGGRGGGGFIQGNAHGTGQRKGHGGAAPKEAYCCGAGCAWLASAGRSTTGTGTVTLRCSTAMLTGCTSMRVPPWGM